MVGHLPRPLHTVSVELLLQLSTYSCPRGGFPSLRHNEIRDLTATLLTEVCNDVQVEPELQEIATETMSGRTANTKDGARLDVAASGFWGGRRERTYIDVRVFNPLAPQTATPASIGVSRSTSVRRYERTGNE